MALIKCPECSREISDKAESCPHCGLPLAKVISETTPCKTVSCLDCNREFDFEAEVCPYCGLFNSQKYKSVEHSSVNESTVNNEPKDEHIDSKIEQCIIGIPWKGLVASIIFFTAIFSFKYFVDNYNEKERENNHARDIINNGKEHLSQAKLLLAKAPSLSDDEWLNVNDHLISIDSSAPDYSEARRLLPQVAKKRDEIIEKRLEEKRKQDKIEEQKQFERETAGLNAKGKRLKQKHPEWSIEECDLISRGKITIGMTKEQVRAAWGRPYTVNTTTAAYGTHEQWVMHEMGSSYVYFEDGICTAIQN